MARETAWVPAQGAPTAAPRLNVGRAEPVRPGVRVVEGRAVAVSRLEDLALFLMVAVPGSLAALWASTVLHLNAIDNLARTYNAVQVLFGNEAKLTNMGFIWPPLPTLLQLPLVALFPSLAFQGGTGPLVSVLAAAVGVVLLNRILALYVPERLFRHLLVVLYQANPLILYLTLSGLAETLFVMFMLLAWWAFQRLYFEEPLPHAQVAVMGVAAGGALLCRYEGAIYSMLLGGVLLVGMYFQKRPRQWAVAEGMALAYMAPWGYAFALWIFVNEMIMRNPVYFLVGKGSNAEFTRGWVASHPSLQTLIGNLPATTLYVLRASWDVLPAFVVVVPLAAVLLVLRRDLFLLFMVVCASSYTGVQWLLHGLGLSAGWLRFYASNVAFGVLLLAYCVRPRFAPAINLVPRWVVALGLVSLLGWSNWFAWSGLDDPAMIRAGEPAFLRGLVQGDTSGFLHHNVLIAAYFRDELFKQEPQAMVLLDDQQANDIILFSGHPDRFVVPNSSRFIEFLRDPVGKVTHLLVPDVVFAGSDLVAEFYPRVYEEGLPFSKLEREFLTTDGQGRGGAAGALSWRLYRVGDAGKAP